MRRTKVNDMSATLGERLRFIGNSLRKNLSDVTEVERITLTDFFRTARGEARLSSYVLLKLKDAEIPIKTNRVRIPPLKP
jgi:hypothetical protein